MTSDIARAASSRITRAFESGVRKGLEKCGYEAGPAPLLIGFSGGADSTALLLSLKSLLAESRPLRAVHVEHGLRGAASRKDAERAGELCRRIRVPFRCERVRVPRAPRRGLEAAAREARRAAFLAVARETGADVLALAHNRDDQAETVLMRLFEGAGARGVSGIRWRTPLSSKEDDAPCVIRPLLDAPRAEILEYLEARGVSWVEDETNEDESRLRNRLRGKILPAIREHLGEAAVGGIARSAEISAPLASFVDEMTADAAGRFIRENDGELAVFPLGEVGRLPRALRAGVWRAAIEGLEGGSRGRRRALRKWIEALDALATGENPSGALSLPDGLGARREYDRLIFGPLPSDSELPEERALRIPGKTLHRSLGVEIEAFPGFAHSCEGLWEARLDAEKLGANACVRTRRGGDRFHPPGRRKERKLKDYLIERKTPKRLRNRIPLLAVENRVAWIIGHGVSAEFGSEGGAGGRGVVLKARSEGGGKPPDSAIAQPGFSRMDGWRKSC